MSFGNLAGPISAGALLDAFGGPNQGAGPYKPAIVSSIAQFQMLITDIIVLVFGWSDDRNISYTRCIHKVQH